MKVTQTPSGSVVEFSSEKVYVKNVSIYDGSDTGSAQPITPVEAVWQKGEGEYSAKLLNEDIEEVSELTGWRISGSYDEEAWRYGYTVLASGSNYNGKISVDRVHWVDAYLSSTYQSYGDSIGDLTGTETIWSREILQVGSIASDTGSVAHGYGVTASGYYSHAEGLGTSASGAYSHAEGRQTIASSYASHAEGQATKALDEYAHAEGIGSEAKMNGSHAEGGATVTNGTFAHAEGFCTTASNMSSHAEGYNTWASNSYEHAQGQYNATASNQIFSVGCGGYDENWNIVRKNAISILTGSGATPSASVFIYGIGGYNGTNPTPGTNDLASVIGNIETVLASI